MFSFEYEDWKMVCSRIFDQNKRRKSTYLQWYPFTRLSKKDKETLISETFFNNYINSGLFSYYSENWLITNNYIMKGDGNFRNASLVSPLMYLVALVIGKSISKVYQSKRPPSVIVFYAGNYDKNRFFYRKDYDEFFKKVNDLAQYYKYFIKIDIKDFFSNIDMNKLFDIINFRLAETNVKINQKDLMAYKELLLCLGQGEFPLIENCTASSYLATVVYLEIPDIRLHSYITDKEPYITNFTMVRYVDDLYILFNSDLSENMITPMVNRILNAYSSELKKLNLSLNRGKTLWKFSTKINEELKKSLYDERYYSKNFKITDFVDNNLLLTFLDRIEELLFNHDLDALKYLELINEIFKIPNAEYTPQEIYNSLVYDKKHTLFKDNKVIDMLLTFVNFDYNFLKLDSKRFIVMLLKTQNEHLIKAMLSKLFEAKRKGVWNIYDTSLAINYLLQRNFRHVDLLKILKDEEPSIYSYYELFCKSSFMASINKSKQKYIRKFGTSIFYKRDDILFYLYFMYMVELKKNNYLAAFAYFKSFFDRISAHFAFTINCGKTKKKGKPNIKKYYKEDELKKLYAGVSNSDSIIEIAHKIRNSNPLCHASAELLDNLDDKYTVAEILNNIEQMYYLIETKIAEYKTNS